jgi:nitronate monooxygenase
LWQAPILFGDISIPTLNQNTPPNFETRITRMLGIKYPIIMAPMFLVSNTKMIKAAIEAGITGAIPALNYRTTAALEAAILELKEFGKGPFGINLIVNSSNYKYKSQLEVCCRLGVDFIITSLGSPEETINRSHEKGIKVFCDVTNLRFAKKVVPLGADALIAVNSHAGGHAGHMTPEELIPMLKSHFDIPIISAGGVGDYKGLKHMLELGADGLSVGSIFIASEECPVSEDYKQAIVSYGKDDIVFTEKLSGSPCTVIKTPYVEKIGTHQNWLEKLLSRNKRLKRWLKALTFTRGMKSLERAAFSTTYETVWCAGPSIEHVHAVRTVQEIVKSLVEPKS